MQIQQQKNTVTFRKAMKVVFYFHNMRDAVQPTKPKRMPPWPPQPPPPPPRGAKTPRKYNCYHLDGDDENIRLVLRFGIFFAVLMSL